MKFYQVSVLDTADIVLLSVAAVFQALLPGNGPNKRQDRYTRLDNEVHEANQQFIDETTGQQQVGEVVTGQPAPRPLGL